MGNAKLVCAACYRDPDVVTNADGELEAVCRGCGQRDDVENAKQIASENFKHQAAIAFQEATRHAVRGSKVVKFEGQRIPKREFDWVFVKA